MRWQFPDVETTRRYSRSMADAFPMGIGPKHRSGRHLGPCPGRHPTEVDKKGYSMSFQQREMSGALFRNDKGGNEARPDYRGDAMIDGRPMEISAWIKEGKNGKFMSLSFKRKDSRQEEPARDTRTHGERKRPSGGFDDMPDDIPF